MFATLPCFLSDDPTGNSSSTSCITHIVNATSAFGPLANSSSNSCATANASSISTALNSLCSTSSSSLCSGSAVRSSLVSFYTACPSVLTGSSSNKDVIRICDVLYTLVPRKATAFTKTTAAATASRILARANPCLHLASRWASLSVGSKSVSFSSGYEFVQSNSWASSPGHRQRHIRTHAEHDDIPQLESCISVSDTGLELR
ncbi:hypothetical protein DFH11DRAFT_1873385 [Phellopilus nigrolimitatus]|nr:hypothetical protein DFH11DRAFT_1873385 [Phellopilus nigrolimitatus]